MVTCMEDSVVKELLAENTELRKRLKDLEEKPGFSSAIHILSEAPLKITGVLISEGVWKGIKYSYEEMVKALPKFEKLKGLVMHGKTEEFKDRPIGELTKVSKDDILRAIVFEAIITDEEAAKKVKEGVFDAVSLKGEFKELDTSKTPPEGKDYTPIEWSLTGSPACETCLIFSVQELCRSLGENFIRESGSIEGTGGNMSEDILEIREDQFLVLPDNADQLEDFSVFEAELVDFDTLIELAKKKKVKAIKVPAGKYPKAKATKIVKIYGYYYPYYGYPYYYYYGYPYYYYYEGGLDELLDLLDLEANYREFMKKCLKEKGGGPEALKACAAEWRQKQSAEEESEEKELAKAVCPVCGKEFESLNAFKNHWAEAHEAKYGEYKKVKKIVKKMLEDKDFRDNIKKIIVQLEGSSEEVKKEEPEKKEEPKQEEKKEEAKTEEVQKVPEEAPKEVSEEELLKTIKRTPEVAADLLLKSLQKVE